MKFNDEGYRITSSIYWERCDWDDGSFTVTQHTPGSFDKILSFGPLSTTLNQLFKQGFFLFIDGWRKHRNQNLYITKEAERYKVARISTADLDRYADLTHWIKPNMRPHVELSIAAIPDPFETLMAKYPKRIKPVEFVGNQTLKQYVSQQLKEKTYVI